MRRVKRGGVTKLYSTSVTVSVCTVADRKILAGSLQWKRGEDQGANKTSFVSTSAVPVDHVCGLRNSMWPIFQEPSGRVPQTPVRSSRTRSNLQRFAHQERCKALSRSKHHPSKDHRGELDIESRHRAKPLATSEAIGRKERPTSFRCAEKRQCLAPLPRDHWGRRMSQSIS